ncbi:MAG: c-type cytochrome biogenesis protein CcsB [Christensenellales bacterium]
MNHLQLETIFFVTAALLYLASALLYGLFFALKKEKPGRLAGYVILLAFLAHTAALAVRTAGAGRLPFSNQYEFATSFAWGIALAFLIFARSPRYRALGTFVAPLIFLIIGYAALQSREVNQLMPALQSNWLAIHVSTAIISYGSFGVACGGSLLYLLHDRLGGSEFAQAHFPDKERLDLLNYRVICLGFLFLTLVILTGAIWAQKAWGRYWTWDPKETWSLVTWIIYAIYLHLRISRGWRGRKAAWFAVIGFLCVIFTYIGVNTLIPSIHSYA